MILFFPAAQWLPPPAQQARHARNRSTRAKALRYRQRRPFNCAAVFHPAREAEPSMRGSRGPDDNTNKFVELARESSFRIEQVLTLNAATERARQ
jgi:hypothetical protein